MYVRYYLIPVAAKPVDGMIAPENLHALGVAEGLPARGDQAGKWYIVKLARKTLEEFPDVEKDCRGVQITRQRLSELGHCGVDVSGLSMTSREADVERRVVQFVRGDDRAIEDYKPLRDGETVDRTLASAG